MKIRIKLIKEYGKNSIITKQLAKRKISVERLIQIPNHKLKTASIVIITHKINEYSAQRFLKSIRSNKNILKNPILIRLL